MTASQDATAASGGPLGGAALQLLGPSSGGIRRHVATLAEGLATRGVEAPVVGPAGVMDGLWPQAGVVPVPARTSPVGLASARRRLAPWRGRSRLVHCHGLKAGWTAVGGRPVRPVVLTVHNVVLDRSRRPDAVLRRRLEAGVLRRADRVIALSGSMAEELSSVVPAERLRVALPASSPPVPRRTSAEVRAALAVGDRPLVVCAARLHPQKDLATLLHAWAEVARSHPDAVLVVVGDGPERGALEDLRGQLGLADSVRMPGASAHAVDEIAAADVVVMTSVWEGAALVLAEAMQLGVPVVSTPVGVAPDLLDGTTGGVLVPVGDPGRVASALTALLDDPGRRCALGAAGRDLAVGYFDPDAAVDRILAVYEELVP